jgi:ORF6N domain
MRREMPHDNRVAHHLHRSPPVNDRTEIMPADNISRLIHSIRDQRIILDSDLAKLYGIQTFRLNEAVKRNRERFPEDFLFQLTQEERDALTSQIAMSKPGRGGRRTLPYAFTEHGAIMAANVLNSPRAAQMSVFVVRAFVKMRAALTDTRELGRKLAALEAELKSRLDTHEVAIVEVLQRIMRILDPPPPPPDPPPPEIGFHVKEDAVPYRIKRRTARP